MPPFAERAGSDTAVSDPLIVHPLGGLDAIGTSSFLLDDGETAILIDAGRSFPSSGGLLVPESPLLDKALPRLAALACTHGHFDHAAAVSLILEGAPRCTVLASEETIAFLSIRYGLPAEARTRKVRHASSERFGRFTLTALRVEHSIPGALAWLVEHERGSILYTGDFSGMPAETRDILGEKHIGLAFCDCTNAPIPRPGPGEADVVAGIGDWIGRHADGRVLMTTFSSNLGRIKAALAAGRQAGMLLFVDGEAMLGAIGIIRSLDRDAVRGVAALEGSLPESPALILASGCQGEESSAFMRLLSGASSLTDRDAIVISASPVPGNEEDWRAMLRLAASSRASLAVPPLEPVHASGHAVRPVLGEIIGCIRPRILVPVHGDAFQRRALAGLGTECGIKTVLPGNGDQVRWDEVPGLVFLGNSLQSGKHRRLPEVGAYERSLMARHGVACFVLRLNPPSGFAHVSLTMRGCLRADQHQKDLESLRDACEVEILDGYQSGTLGMSAIRRKIQAWAELELEERFGLRPLVIVSLVNES